MESWRFDSVTNADDIVEGNMGSVDFGYNMDHMVFVSHNAMSIENQEFGEMCLPQVGGSCLFNLSTFSEEHKSSSVVGSNCKESGQFDLDLKLDRSVVKKNPHICSPFKNTNNLNSSKVSVPSKQTRITHFSSSSPICQVHRCNKSLVSCKDYHKRHKVCELHSKTDKVIVNGIVQRFCQQCSRFHLLSEFDDGKRSCRKRLADHNERRRKPYAGRKFRASTRSKGISPSTRNIKLEDEMVNNIQSISSITDVQLHSVTPCDLGTQYPSFHASGSVLYPFINNYQTVSADDFITMDQTAARSLLSFQSQGDSSSHSSRNSMMLSSSTHNTHQASVGSNYMNMLEDSVYVNPETRVWSGDRFTIDLLQLSSELERVELQKEILHTKCA